MSLSSSRIQELQTAIDAIAEWLESRLSKIETQRRIQATTKTPTEAVAEPAIAQGEVKTGDFISQILGS